MIVEPREHFWNVNLVGLFYLLALLALILCVLGSLPPVRRWRSGWRAHRKSPAGHWLGDVFAAAGVFRGDPAGGLAHLAVFWGFVVLFLGTVLLTIDHHLITFLTGRAWLIYSLTLDLFGAAFILGLLWLLLRRYVLRRSLIHHKEPEDSSLLVLLLVIAVTGFLAEGFRLAQTNPPHADWSPVGAWLSRLLPEGALAAHRAVWWIHAICSLTLVAWLPLGKLRHAFTSALHRIVAAGTPVFRTAEERERAGVAFGAHELLAVDACTRCNRCENACPSAGVAEQLSPRQVIADLARAGLAGLGPDRRSSASPDEVPWLCTSCGACRAVCPVEIDAADLIRETRGYLVEEGERVPAGVARALESIAKHGNPWEGKRSKRVAWTADLDLKDFSRGDSAPLLWWPGCELAFDTRCQKVARATATLLSAAGVEFMIAGKEETNSGDLARRSGEDGLFEMMIEENSALFTATGVESVVISSPHDWHAFRFEYPRLLPLLPDAEGEIPPARHVTELLAEKIDDGALGFVEAIPRRVTFHDPCYLGRHHRLLDAPRRILRALPGVELVEMEEHGMGSRCCGGGGGRMFFEPEEAGGVKMSERRVRQAVETGSEVLATACPWCLIQFEDAIKTAGLEGRLRVADLTELAAEVLRK